MRILEFEWDDGNALHIELGHGVTPSEAEEVFALCPLFKGTKKGHYAVFGPTAAGRYLVIIFQMKPGGVARAITGWDMKPSEIKYYKRQRSKR
jgi:uncharacterized DUF497 family protein